MNERDAAEATNVLETELRLRLPSLPEINLGFPKLPNPFGGGPSTISDSGRTRLLVDESILHQAENSFQVGFVNSAFSWVRAVNRTAGPGNGGYPDFEIFPGNKRGCIHDPFSKWFDLSEEELHSAYHEFKIGEINSALTWARAGNFVASKRNYIGAYPTFEVGTGNVRGFHFIENNSVKFLDIEEKYLSAADPDFQVGRENEFIIWSRAINRFATAIGALAGIPNYLIGKNRVHGAFLLG